MAENCMCCLRYASWARKTKDERWVYYCTECMADIFVIVKELGELIGKEEK